MEQFTIQDSDYASLRGKVVVITGASSGIGLATAQLLLDVGASVVNGDILEPTFTHPNLSFIKTDVTSWPSQLALFAHAVQKHQRIDHVFANAGIGGRANYLESKFSESGELLEPSSATYDINLRGMINTAYLGLHHFRTQNPPGGSVVCTASASSFQGFSIADYGATKHGIWGFVRGVAAGLRSPQNPVAGIRINAVGPDWTESGLVPRQFIEAAKLSAQGPEVVARKVALLFADEARQGQFVYSVDGKYYELESAVFAPATKTITSVRQVHEPLNSADFAEAVEKVSKQSAA